VTAAIVRRPQKARYGLAGIAAGALLLLTAVWYLRDRVPETGVNGQTVREPRGAPDSAGRDTSSRLARDRFDDGLYYLGNMDATRDDFEQMAALAIAKFEASIATDPSWALPHAELGGVLHRMRHLEGAEERLQRAEEHVREAIELDPGLGSAHTSLAYILAVKGQYTESAELFERAISLGAEAHWGKAILLRTIGRHDEAIREFELAIRDQPSELVLRFQLFETYYCARRYADTIDGLEEFFGEDYEPYVGILLANSHARLGNTEKALYLAEAHATEYGDESAMAAVFALVGQDGRARRALDQLDATEPFIVVDVAPAAIVLGERERAIALLEDAAIAVQEDISLRNDWLWRFQCMPEIQSLQGHPRFEALVERLDLPSTRFGTDRP
jgi:tetratricopeptide (TPR) repeat protein